MRITVGGVRSVVTKDLEELKKQKKLRKQQKKEEIRKRKEEQQKKKEGTTQQHDGEEEDEDEESSSEEEEWDNHRIASETKKLLIKRRNLSETNLIDEESSSTESEGEEEDEVETLSETEDEEDFEDDEEAPHREPHQKRPYKKPAMVPKKVIIRGTKKKETTKKKQPIPTSRIMRIRGWFRHRYFPDDVKNIFSKTNMLNIIRTIIYCLDYIYFGLMLSVLGPVLTTLRNQVGVEEEAMGYVFIARGIGLILGSLIGGKCVEWMIEATGRRKKWMFPEENIHINAGSKKKKIEMEMIDLAGIHKDERTVVQRIFGHTHVVITIVLIFMSSINLTIPFITQFWLMLLVHVGIGFGGAYIDIWCNGVPFYIWKEKANPWIQLVHCSFSLGAMIAPLVVTLVFANIENDQHCMLITFGSISIYGFLLAFLHLVFPSPHVILPPKKRQTLKQKKKHGVRATVGRIASHFTSCDSFFKLLKENLITNGFWAYFAMTLFIVFNAGVEIAGSGLLASSVVDNGIMDKVQASLLTFVFCGALAVGGIISTGLSLVIKPYIMLMIDLMATVICSVIMVIYPRNVTLIFVSVGVYGFFLSSMYPSALSFPKVHCGAKVSGFLTGMMIVGGSFGEMTLPYLSNVCMQKLGDRGLWVATLVFLTCATLILAVLLLILVVRRCCGCIRQPRKPLRPAAYQA